jgi:CubicO group peptidase (beta-lactamase class C family)
VEALRQVDDWPVRRAALAVISRDGPIAQRGDATAPLPWASVTKLVTALAALVAAEEGVVDLDEAAGPPGSTIRHLLSHASGLPPEGETPIAKPGARRIYSNAGFEVLAETVARAA